MEPQAEEKENFVEDNMPMPRDNILLRKLATPKQVRLLNGKTFVARCERVNRRTLAPTNVRIRRTYRHSIGPRRQRLRYFGPRRQRRRRQQPQQETGIETNVIRGLNLEKKAANTELGCMIVDDPVRVIPKVYRKLKNKLFRRKNLQQLRIYIQLQPLPKKLIKYEWYK